MAVVMGGSVGGRGVYACFRSINSVAVLSQVFSCEDIRDGREAVRGLVRGYVVDMRRIRQVRGLVLDVSRQRMRLVTARERLVQRRRLNDALVGELLMRGRHDAKSRRRLATRCAGCFHRPESIRVRHLLRAIDGRVARARGLLEPRLDDVALLFAHRDAALELLAHCGVLRHEAGGEAGEADVLDCEAACFSRRERRGAFLVRVCGAGVVLGEVELARSVARGGEAGRRGLFLDDDLWGRGISETARGDVSMLGFERETAAVAAVSRLTSLASLLSPTSLWDSCFLISAHGGSRR